ncbi:hypothetical protein Nepgr_007992 [Nepenthes gracilis]|uniref:Uncharacterized protein n=1 Tax=Nepenthes gracilis TaxID=150966 RepID=A0AAD3S8R4_NEPGR|nr:hypothetical protein Nepgr_007992 [Nepenthes gracilis]
MLMLSGLSLSCASRRDVLEVPGLNPWEFELLAWFLCPNGRSCSLTDAGNLLGMSSMLHTLADGEAGDLWRVSKLPAFSSAA